jgi:hypothetical protein
MQSFLARITPISNARPDNTLPGQPPGIWGPTDPRPTPPIYVPVPPPGGGGGGGGEHPEHPIYIPVYPAHPIVLPLPPTDARPMPPIYIPPYTPPVDPGYSHPESPVDPGYGIDAGLRPEHPIYIPITGGGEHPENPIYFPVEPTHPIVLPPDGETPTPPPGMVQPPSGQPGFWGYSYYYNSFVFVPYAGVGPNSDRPEVNPLRSR